MSEETVQDGSQQAEKLEPNSKTDKKDTQEKPSSARMQANAHEVKFSKNITIYPKERLAHYDNGEIKAYAARGRGGARENLFAMICDPALSPRTKMAETYTAVINPYLAKLVSSGVVFWPEAAAQRYCFVYESNLGNPLIKDDIHGGLGWKPEDVINTVIRSMVSVLADLRDKDIVHGNIRASNLYDGGTKKIERVILGDCLTSPASSQLPVLYETIDRSLADPVAKGIGLHRDDMYSFGVALSVILRTQDPLEGLSDEQIIEAKLEQGSYVALTGKDRFKGAVLELLRGLLHDDVTQRWGMDDVQVWLDGRRLSPKQAAKKFKASRPLDFNGKKYLRPELLAKDFCKNTSEASQLIDNDELYYWVDRALEDKLTKERLVQARDTALQEGKGKNYVDGLVTRVSIALNPSYPIFYKELRVMPEGIGRLLTKAYVEKSNLQSFIDFFLQYYVHQWIIMQIRNFPDAVALMGKLDSCRNFVRQTNVGYGMERCVYHLNPESHCLSEKLKKFYVRTPEDMMYAFEEISSDPDKPYMFFDRHIIAFLSVKDRKNIDPYLTELNASERFKNILGELRTLATIQKRSRMEKFPGIAGWVVENLDPVYERFHDRELRKKIKKNIEKIKVFGDLTKVVSAFDDVDLHQKDTVGFKEAMKKFYNLEVEERALKEKVQDEKTYGQDTGHNISASLAMILSIIVIIASFVMKIGSFGF